MLITKVLGLLVLSALMAEAKPVLPNDNIPGAAKNTAAEHGPVFVSKTKTGPYRLTFFKSPIGNWNESVGVKPNVTENENEAAESSEILSEDNPKMFEADWSKKLSKMMDEDSSSSSSSSEEDSSEESTEKVEGSGSGDSSEESLEDSSEGENESDEEGEEEGEEEEEEEEEDEKEEEEEEVKVLLPLVIKKTAGITPGGTQLMDSSDLEMHKKFWFSSGFFSPDENLIQPLVKNHLNEDKSSTSNEDQQTPVTTMRHPPSIDTLYSDWLKSLPEMNKPNTKFHYPQHLLSTKKTKAGDKPSPMKLTPGGTQLLSNWDDDLVNDFLYSSVVH